MSGRGRWKRHRLNAIERQTGPKTHGVQTKRQRHKIIPSTDVVCTECSPDSEGETDELPAPSPVVSPVVPLYRGPAPTTTDVGDSDQFSPVCESPPDVDNSISILRSAQSTTTAKPTLCSQDTVILNPECPYWNQEDDSQLLRRITPMPSVSCDFVTSFRSNETTTLHDKFAALSANRPPPDVYSSFLNSSSGQSTTARPTLGSQDTVILSPACHDLNQEDDSQLLRRITPMPSVSCDFVTSFRSSGTDTLHDKLAGLSANTHSDQSETPPDVYSSFLNPGSGQSATARPTLGSQDTVILSPACHDLNQEDDSQLLRRITPMPSVSCDFVTSFRSSGTTTLHDKLAGLSANTVTESTREGAKSPDSGSEGVNDGPSMHSQDTLIINPSWHDSEEDLEPLPTLTPMPSVYSDLEASFRTNESIMVHRNLTLLLATTRIAISHDEDHLQQLDLDISRLKRGLEVKTTEFDRLVSRGVHVRSSLDTLSE